ncbi:MAG: hypothetical protein M3460_20615 [Actinomycetota bacterium]|nr:hypothetical protein [Actinomycetota bacterium]
MLQGLSCELVPERTSVYASRFGFTSCQVQSFFEALYSDNLDVGCSEEMTARNHQIDQHEAWIERALRKFTIDYDPAP